MLNKNIFIIIGLLILISLGVILGVSLKPKPQPTTLKPETPTVTQPTQKSQQKQEPIDTSNWKTYRNEKYGFEVRYPEEWWLSLGVFLEDEDIEEKLNRGITFREIPEQDRLNINIIPYSKLPRTIEESIKSCELEVVYENRERCQIERQISQEEILKIKNQKKPSIPLERPRVQNFNGVFWVYGLLWSPHWGGYSAYAEIISNDNDLISLEVPLRGEKQEAYNDSRNEQFYKILSTFKFIN
jgi:hypothetical protein